MGKRTDTAAEGISLLAQAILRGQHALADELVDALGAGFPAGEVETAAGDALVAAVARTWDHGWQVADLVHSLGRKLAAPDRRLLVRTVLAAAERWRHLASADEAWVAQLDGLDDAGGDAGPLVGGWAKAERLHPFDALHRAATLLGLLWTQPPLDPIGPPPSAWGTAPRPRATTNGAGPSSDDRILGRIRGLLAKAESTEFQPEAEALSAKAQELMTRYSIDHALLAGAGGDAAARGEQPAQRRLLIHDPYAKGKSVLLAQVAKANRCQAIWFAEAGFCTVVGFPTDLALTDLLFTSLVTQCSTAMQVASRDVRQPRSFRESFTLAFALRIGERLEQAAEASVAEAVAERGADLLPVLASRDEEVEQAFERAFPHRRSSSLRVSDGRGWDAGRAAADVASIAAAKAVGH
jgi:hypothetical protein